MATCKHWQLAVYRSFTLQGREAVYVARKNEEEKSTAPKVKVIWKYDNNKPFTVMFWMLDENRFQVVY